MSRNNLIRGVVIAVADKIPEVGFVVSSLLEIFWPPEDEAATTQSAWDEVKDKVEKLVDDKIFEAELDHHTEAVKGLKSALTSYSEKGALDPDKGKDLSFLVRNIATNFFDSLYGSPNAFRFLPLLVGFAHVHLGVLLEQHLYGASLGLGLGDKGDMRNPRWLDDLVSFRRLHRLRISILLSRWREWRRGFISQRTWERVDQEHVIGPANQSGPVDIYIPVRYRGCEVRDDISGEKISHEIRANADPFQALAYGARMRMVRQAEAEIISTTMSSAFMLDLYVPGQPVVVDSDLEFISLGPFSSATLGDAPTGPAEATMHDGPGTITSIVVKDSALQLVYGDHLGIPMGMESGEASLDVKLPPDVHCTGMKMAFWDTNLKAVEVCMSNNSRAASGVVGFPGGGGAVAQALVGPDYALVGMNYSVSLDRSAKQLGNVVELVFKYSQQHELRVSIQQSHMCIRHPAPPPHLRHRIR